MTAQDRKMLEELRLSQEVIARTEEVLRVWEVEELFVVCSYCSKPCINPDVRRRQFRRKKPPADLFLKAAIGFRDWEGRVICWACDEDEFQ